MPEMKDSGIEWIGEIPEDWEIVRIKEKYQFETGFTPDTAHSEYYEDEQGYEWVTIADLNKGTISHPTKALISRNYVNARNKTPIPSGSLLYSFKLSVGQTAIVDRPVYTNEAIASFLPKKDICLRFLMYSSMFIEYNGNTNIYGAYILNQQLINNSRVVFPDLYIQEKIADFLDSKCAEIDALIADIEKEIALFEEYKKSVITEAVTKGLDPSVEMKDSGIEWIGVIPKDWKVYRIADIYEDRNERGNDELPLLSVSINTGVSDKELTDEEQERVFLRSEDKSKYKRVYPGDITYNMMRAWQGALGAVRVEGMVSPAYVVAKPTGRVDVDSRFIEMLLRSVAGIEEINRYSYGIMDFRKRLYWPQFRIIKVALPNVIEQKKIADYLDEKSKEIDEVILQQKETIDILMNYKKSLIYEYVTGKKEVSVG